MVNNFKKINTLEHLIGNTPLIRINFKYKGKLLHVYTKLEYYNYSGSLKDRVALYMIKKAYIDKKLSKDGIIVEATSGNTGISFCALGTFLGHEVHIFMPDYLSEERKKLLKSYNAVLHLVSKKDGGFKKCISLTQEMQKNNIKVFLPSQFSNEDNVDAHYYNTAPEIYKTLEKNYIHGTDFVAGVGTGGTVMGIGKYFRYKFPHFTVHPLEPANSPTLRTNTCVSSHRIQGISDEFIPPILKLNKLDSIIDVDDGDSIVMSQMFSKQLGLGIGISSGANFLGAIKVLEENNFIGNVITIFADDNKKYLSTALMNNEPIKDNFISSNVELIDFDVLE